MFGKRYHILKVQGISIGIDISWLFIAILLTWTLAAGYFPFYYPNLHLDLYLLMGIIGMLGLFLSIVLHELGHALTAKRFGLPISRITLFLFGGIAELKQDPPSPKAEFAVAVAGPLVSIALLVIFYIFAFLGDVNGWPIPVVAVLSYLAVINLVVVIFNLVPAFPLDGGRIFRALLWWLKGSLGWATKVSSAIGAAFGFILMLLGVFVLVTGNFIAGIWWMILGFFLQNAASMSRTQYFIKKELRGEQVAKYMIKEPLTVPPDITIQDFIDHHVYKTYHHLYPVEVDGLLLGYISLEEVKGVERDKWRDKKVGDIIVPLNKIKTLSPYADVFEAFNLFNDAPRDALMVTENDRLVGLLSLRDIFKIISLKLEIEPK